MSPLQLLRSVDEMERSRMSFSYWMTCKLTGSWWASFQDLLHDCANPEDVAMAVTQWQRSITMNRGFPAEARQALDSVCIKARELKVCFVGDGQCGADSCVRV